MKSQYLKLVENDLSLKNSSYLSKLSESEQSLSSEQAHECLREARQAFLLSVSSLASIVEKVAKLNSLSINILRSL